MVSGLSNPHAVDGFGLFDLLITDLAGHNGTKKITSGKSEVFKVRLSGGSGSITADYFYDGSETTTVTGGETAVVVGAFFDANGNTPDAYGASLATVPEPSTLLLLVFSMLTIARFRCRLC